MPTEASIREFVREDFYGWAGAESWSDDQLPWILEVEFEGDISRDLLLQEMSHGYAAEFGVHTQFATAVADKHGIGLYFTGPDGEQGPMFDKSGVLEPEVAEGALKAIARHLSEGRIPPGFVHNN